MNWLVWAGFIIFVLIMLAVDLGFFQKESRDTSTRKSLIWVFVCVCFAMVFSVLIYFIYDYKLFSLVSNLSGADAWQQFFTAWLLEQSLGLDNVFVFALIFSFFRIPPELRHRVLLWGIIGALILRGVMIGLGAQFLAMFWWAEYVFALLLLYAAFKMAFLDEESFDPSTNILYRLARKVYPVSEHLDGEKFFTRLPDGRRAITPLFLVLLVIENSDVLFAVDSIPAVFGVTKEPFIVFTSNIFAILNLRSLYFVLASMMNKFHYLKYSLIIVLIFIALKMLLHHFLPVSTLISMTVVVVLLVGGILVSIFNKDRLVQE